MSRRLDYLPNHEEIKIYQDDEMFCINTDTMVLGEFLDIKKKDIVLDIGTNTGALLLYASKFKPKKLIGIDINEKALELAKENTKYHCFLNFCLHIVSCFLGGNYLHVLLEQDTYCFLYHLMVF